VAALWIGIRRGQQSGNLPQFGAGPADGRSNCLLALAGVAARKRQRGLWFTLRSVTAVELIEGLPGAGECISLGVDKALDLQDQLDVAPTVEPLAGSALVGFELRKLRLPKAQDVSLDLADARNVTNLEVETVGDQGRVEGALLGKLRGHIQDEEKTAIGRELALNAV